MKKTQIKDVFRNIRANAVSWLAVVIVVTITCGVYCGVFFYADALEDTAGEFFARANFEDLTVTAAQGLTRKEIDVLRAVPGVEDAEGTYRFSGAALRWDGRSHGASVLAVTERISVPELLEGAMPESGMECGLTSDVMERLRVSIGDEVELELGGFPPLSFTVTGVLRHPDTYYQGETTYVFVPAGTMEQLLGPDRCPVVLIDASSQDLARVRAGLREKTGGDGFVITARQDHESYMVLGQIVDILRKLSTIFVVIFVCLGAIVVTSTITVVIDGQKQQIGFLKACGFRNGEIIRRYLVYGETAVAVGMVCTFGVAFLLQLVIRNVLDGMFCLEVERFSFRLGPYFLLLLLEAALTGAIAAWVTASTAAKYSAVELMSWNGSAPGRRDRAGKTSSRGTLYSRLIYRNIRSDRVRVGASTIIIAGCCFLIGIGLTLNSAFHSMTVNTRREVALYDLECALRGDGDLDAVEDAVRGSGATCVRAAKTRTLYGYDGLEEYVTVVTAEAEVFRDHLRLIGPEGKPVEVPGSGAVLIQDRIGERLGIRAGEEIRLYDAALTAHPVTVAGTARNYIGRVIYLSRDTYASVFGSAPAANTLLVRLNGTPAETLAHELTARFPEIELSYTDHLPGMFAGLTDAFDALIYVLITLSVILSVFVLLNLVNIFVHRRQNELIIMGINGFSYRQEIGYLLRETIATTAVGLAAGALFGALITRPVVQIIESADTMCVRSVNWKAWAAGMAVEAVFALVINLYAFRRVKRLGIKDLQ